MQAFRRHLLIAALLVAASAAIQAALISRAVVPALDAVRFATLARQIDAQGLLATARSQHEHPLFGAWVCVVHRGLVGLAGEFPTSWALSTQLAAAIPLVLTLIPLYALSLWIYGARAAIAGCLFFACLPEIARLGPEGISDSTNIFFFSLAFAACVGFFMARFGWGKRRGPCFRPVWLFAAGLATAIALQVRMEIMVLPASLAAAGLLYQLSPATRLPWSRWAVAAGAYALGIAALFGPFLVVTGATTPEAVVRRLRAAPGDDEIPWCKRADEHITSWDGWRLPDGGRMSFAPKDPGLSLRQQGVLPSLVRFGNELAKLYWYWVGLLALYALGRARGRCRQPADRFVWTFIAVDATVTVAFSAWEGYLVSRHMLPLVMATIGGAGWGAVDLGRRLCVWMRRREHPPFPAGMYWVARPGWVAAMVVLVAAAGCLAKNFKPLNFNASGHRAAADWLAREAPLPGAVVDTHGWAGLLSGRKMHMFFEGRTAFIDPEVRYVILEEEELSFSGRRSQTLRQLLDRAGQRVAVFAGVPSATRNRSVVVYLWRPELLTNGRCRLPGGTCRCALSRPAGGIY